MTTSALSPATSRTRWRSVWSRVALMLAMAAAFTFVSAAKAEAAVPVTYYELQARHSFKCAHVVDGAVFDGAFIRQRFCYQPRHQYWRIVPSSVQAGYFELRAWHSDKCLGVRAGGFEDGALIHQWVCNGARSQQWRRVALPGGWWQLRALHSNKCLDVRFGDVADWAWLQQWQCGAQLQQQWRFA